MVSYIKRARKIGGSLVVTIPMEIAEILEIKDRDFVKVVLEKVNEK